MVILYCPFGFFFFLVFVFFIREKWQGVLSWCGARNPGQMKKVAAGASQGSETGKNAPLCQLHVCLLVSDCLQPYGLCSPPGSSVHGTFQTTILKWVAISKSFRGSYWPRDWSCTFRVSCTAGRFFTTRAIGGANSALLEGSWMHQWGPQMFRNSQTTRNLGGK